MKRYVLSLIFAVAVVAGWAADKNFLVADNVQAPIGAQYVTLPIKMTNANKISDVQFDLQLPSGVSIAKTSGGNYDLQVLRVANGSHDISAKAQADGAVRILCTSASGAMFSGQSGDVLNIKLALAQTVAPGTYSIGITNVVLSSVEATYTPAKTTATITIQKTATLTFKLDGEVLVSKKVVVGTPISSPTPEERTGYTFSGWGDVPTVMPDGDLELTGTYVPNKYRVKFVADGQEVYNQLQDYGSTITPPTAPTKQGYTFASWGTVLSTVPAEDVEFTAAYTVNQYNVTFKVDGQVYKTLAVNYGATITAPTAPTKEGHTFSGWTSVPTAMPDSDVVITGTFAPNQYRVKFVADGQVVYNQLQNYGSTITPPEAPAKKGHSFAGWGTVPATVPAEDVEFTAAYTVNQYTITFKVDGEVYKTLTLDYGATLTAPEAPEKEGFVFSGWAGVVATVPAENLTYEATFSKGNYVLKYVVDGVDYKTLALDYGDSIIPEAAPVKEGYTFGGWDEVPATMPADNVTITGTFTINQYTITFMVDSAEYKTLTLDYGATITAPNAPEKEGHTFASWGNVPATVPAENLSFTASYTVNSYKVAFMVGDDLYAEATVEYGDTITVPAEEPTKEGYSFEGWGEIPAQMPAHDLTLTAQFKQSVTPGDVNQDASINAADVVAIYTYISQGDESGVSAAFADVNGDAVVNAADVTAVYNIIAGR